MTPPSLSAMLLIVLSNTEHATLCINNQDSYSNYDNYVAQSEINNITSDYYVLSYSWSPNYCANVSDENKQAGEKDYLQCGSDTQFGYILHGLWPQGKFDNTGGYPRACEGNQTEIPREILNNYLCMTPSVWLLQHEYEFHGTCMHDEALETPQKYLDAAWQLHSKIKLPNIQLSNNQASIQWFLDNNPHLSAESIQYYHGGQEWQFCYDNNFKVMACPNN